MMKKLRLFSFLTLLVLLPATSSAQSVFLNELHYDNASSDAGEAIEIAGPAGTDLTGWTVALYNGNGNSVYSTITLNGIITNQTNGYGTLNFPVSGIQNGGNDGLALVDDLGNVIQFLSYEGTLTAEDGPAIGLTSIDIGIAETGDTPVGASLSLTGEGSTYEDFTWAVAETNSFGAVNDGQIFSGGELAPLINEFVFNHTGSDTDEFIEVIAFPDTDLSAFSIVVIEGDNNAPGVIDGVYPLGTTNTEGIYVTDFFSNAFENGTQSILLVSDFTGAAGTDLDTDDDGILDVTPWTEIFDAVGVNDSDAGDYNYSNVVLAEGYDGDSFTVGGASRIPNGTDSDTDTDWVRNSFSGEGLPSFPDAVAENGEALNTPGASNEVKVVIEPFTLIINELDADTEGTDAMEFVELYDGGVGNSVLDGYVVVFYNGSNDQSYAAYDLDGFTTNASGYFVLGNADVPNVSITFSNNGLQNGADAVALYQGDAADFDGVAVTLDNLVDAVVYDTNDSDDAGLLPLLTSGDQLNEDALSNKDIHSLQRFTNGSGDLRSTLTYVNAIPTPGYANTNATEPITVVINELDADTPGNDTAEFIELFDGGSGNTPLDGLVLVLYNGNGDTSYNAIDLDGYTTTAEGYFVIGNEGVFNVNLVVGANSLQNGADAAVLYQGDATDFPNGTAVSLNAIVDAIVYSTGDATDDGLLPLLNEGQLQLDENANDSQAEHSLQRIPNGSGGARNTETYVADTPTPGAANDAVITPQEPITIAEARATAEGETVTISGILTVSDQLGGPAYMQDATGGIAIFDESVHGMGTFNIGDSITVTGTRTSFNGLVQLSPINVVSLNDPATGTVEPVTITLAELGNYPGQLVRIADVSFPTPGDLFFGNSNYVLTDASGNAELRIDSDVEDLVGKAQPETCYEVIGVVSRFNETFQLLPRLGTDLPCAEEFVPEGDTVDIPKEDTFDIVAWNIEWFGDEANSPASGPMSDPIQRDSVLTVLKRLDADVFTVEEISDDALFAELVSLLPGYDYVLSNAVSYPDGTPPFQKVGFIYKTETVSPVKTQALLATIHPYYNGGDDSYLSDYPEPDHTRFYASGRLPFLMTADVTINGSTEQLDLVALHARANSSDGAQGRYDMRKYDVEVLKDSLDVQFADRNVIILGDYNDDVDETVADGINTTVSSYVEYVNDMDHYNIVTSALSEAGRRSYVFRENMIDHITVTDELFDNYIDGTATVHYEVYDNDYTFTTSDHFPVSARFKLTKPFSLGSVEVDNVTCNGADDGMATLIVTGGVEPYSYLWSDGQTTATAFDLSAGTYSVTATDANGNMVEATDIVVTEPDAITFATSDNTTIYLGYDDNSCTELSVSDIVVGEGPYEVNWSTEETGESITVCPEETTIYMVTVTDANGCSVTKDITVTVEDVSCGNGRWSKKVQVCFRGKTLCVSKYAVPALLRNGGSLGSCSANDDYVITDVRIVPNPVRNKANLFVTSTSNGEVSFEIYNFFGHKVYQDTQNVQEGQTHVKLNISNLRSGIYFLKPMVNGFIQQTKILVKK